MNLSDYYRLDDDKSVAVADDNRALFRLFASSVTRSLVPDGDCDHPPQCIASTTPQTMDWASDDGVEYGARQLRRSGSDSVTIGPLCPGSIPGESPCRQRVRALVYRNEKPVLRPSAPAHGDKLPPATLSSPNCRTKRTTVPVPTLLHGKDILLEIMDIHSMDPDGRDAESMKWTTSLGAVEDSEELSLMDPLYDLTSARMKKLFSSFNPQDNGMVSYEGFRRGLEAMGISCRDDELFQAFIEKMDDDQSGGITYHEFVNAIQEIKLAQLFNPEYLRNMPLEDTAVKPGSRRGKTPAVLGSIEYSPDRIRSVHPIDQVQRFIYSTKPNWATVRWINVEGIDPLLMRRLAVRYRLHPLAVEDTLDTDVERPKYDEYDEHLSLVVQTIHARDLWLVKKYQSMYRASLYVHDEDVSPFDSMTKKNWTNI